MSRRGARRKKRRRKRTLLSSEDKVPLVQKNFGVGLAVEGVIEGVITAGGLGDHLPVINMELMTSGSLQKSS